MLIVYSRFWESGGVFACDQKQRRGKTMSFKKTLLAAAAVVALPLMAQAQPVSGLYR